MLHIVFVNDRQKEIINAIKQRDHYCRMHDRLYMKFKKYVKETGLPYNKNFVVDGYADQSVIKEIESYKDELTSLRETIESWNRYIKSLLK